MTITVPVNGTAHTLPAGATVAQLVRSWATHRTRSPPRSTGFRCAREARAQVLQDGDAVLLFPAHRGG